MGKKKAAKKAVKQVVKKVLEKVLPKAEKKPETKEDAVVEPVAAVAPKPVVPPIRTQDANAKSQSDDRASKRAIRHADAAAARAAKV